MMIKTTDSYEPVSHVWILIDDKVEIEESPNHNKHHSDIWGNEVWDNPIRGYFSEKKCLVSCHSYQGVDRKIIKKIEKALDKKGLVGIYFKGEIKELCEV